MSLLLTFTLIPLIFLSFDLFFIFIDKVENFSEEHEKNSHHIYKNAEEDSTRGNTMQKLQLAGYKADEIQEMILGIPNLGKGQNAPSETSSIKGSVRTGLYEWDNDFEDSRSEDCILNLDSDPLLEMKDEDFKKWIGKSK